MQEGMELTPSEYHALLRNDLYTFMVRCFSTLSGHRVYAELAPRADGSRLEECVSGKRRRLIINLPPRHLKSLLSLGRAAGFHLGSRSVGADNLRQLCHGTRRKNGP